MEYEKIAKEARIKVLDLIYSAQTSHIGSNFSCIDIMTVLFQHFNWEKDKFILSKGWAAASLYYFLWKAGRITEEELNSYCQKNKTCERCEKLIVTELQFGSTHSHAGCPCECHKASKFIGLVEPHDCLECDGTGFAKTNYK